MNIYIVINMTIYLVININISVVITTTPLSVILGEVIILLYLAPFLL